MSTNSRIGILHEDGTTETIYCHWDGYPEHQMPILTEHYNTAEKVKALLALPEAERIVMGERARAFVLREKNAKAQCAKLIAFMRDLHARVDNVY